MNTAFYFAVITILSASANTAIPESIRITCIQMEVRDAIPENLTRIEQGIREAAVAGARVAVFPEAALSGFSRKTIAALDWDALDAARQRVAALAKEHDIYVIYGSATCSGKDKPFNSGIVVNPAGEEIFIYHKMYPEGWFTPGDHLALFEIDGIPCTMIVCHDSRFPDLVRLPVLSGARICFYISYEINGMEAALRKAEGYRAQLIARAVENGIWLVQSNGIGPLDDSDHKSLGHSRIIEPGGQVLQEAPRLEDVMLVETLHPREALRSNALESLENPYMTDWLERGKQLVTPEPVVDRHAEKDIITLGLMQTVPEKWNLEKNFATFLELLDQAKDADIIITPECWLDGYAAPDKASTPERLREVAQAPKSSSFLQRVAEEARTRKQWICFGFTSLEDDKIYNAAGLWNDTGKLVGIYHKTHIQTHDCQYTPGEALPVWPTPWGPVGIMICADRRWPETARTLRLKGARLILNPTYGMHHEANTWWMRTRSYENQCFIAFTHPSTGFVTNPHGDIVDKRDEQPGVLLVRIDLREAKDDNHLRDRRPDLYQVITER